MTEPVLIDTGPLVAFLSQTDSEHARCVEQFQNLTQTPITCWPVLTEAAWLLRKRVDNVKRLLDLWSSDIIRVEQIDDIGARWIYDFLERFSDQNPQLADVSLCWLADDLQLDTIFTLDRRDFSVYRLSNDRKLEIVP